MIILDYSRNVVHMTNIEDNFINEEFLVIDDIENKKYSFEKGHSDKIIYLQESDLFYSIYDLEKGILLYAPIRCGENSARFYLKYGFQKQIPNLKKILAKSEKYMV